MNKRKYRKLLSQISVLKQARTLVKEETPNDPWISELDVVISYLKNRRLDYVNYWLNAPYLDRGLVKSIV